MSLSIAACTVPSLLLASQPAPRRIEPAAVCDTDHRGLQRAEQPARGARAELERGRAVPGGVREQLQPDAVAEREDHRGDGLRVGVERHHALVLLGSKDVGQVAAPAAVELGHLGAQLLAVVRGADHLVDDGRAPRAHPRPSPPARRPGCRPARRRSSRGQGVLERRDAGVAVAPDDLHQQPLLRAEVVVQQPARDARLAGHDVEGGAGGAAGTDALAHRGDDLLGLLAVELARGFSGGGFHAHSSWPASQEAPRPERQRRPGGRLCSSVSVGGR